MREQRRLSQTILLPPQLLGSVDYYAAVSASPCAIIDTSMRFDKRFKSAHRTTIVDANGRMMLTVPIVRPQSVFAALWSDIIVSPHNDWWNIFMTALRSAYGRTPFYEFYEDDFLAIINREVAGRPLMMLVEELDTLVRRLAGITTVVGYSVPDDMPAAVDYRRRTIDFTRPVSYYQVRSDRHGFMAGLSIVDLLFNMGPETPLILREMT